MHQGVQRNFRRQYLDARERPVVDPDALKVPSFQLHAIESVRQALHLVSVRFTHDDHDVPGLATHDHELDVVFRLRQPPLMNQRIAVSSRRLVQTQIECRPEGWRIVLQSVVQHGLDRIGVDVAVAGDVPESQPRPELVPNLVHRGSSDPQVADVARHRGELEVPVLHSLLLQVRTGELGLEDGADALHLLSFGPHLHRTFQPLGGQERQDQIELHGQKVLGRQRLGFTALHELRPSVVAEDDLSLIRFEKLRVPAPVALRH